MSSNLFENMPDQQLIDYIKQAQATGQNKEEIKSALLGIGWQEKDVDDALSGAVFSAQSATSGVSHSSKLIIIATSLAAVLFIAAGFTYYFYFYESAQRGQLKTESQQQIIIIEKSASSKIMFSNYGFSFSIPDGWHLWEGYSAVLNLLESEGDGFLSSHNVGWTQEQINTYQEFLDLWVPESAKILVFTDADVDYKNRDFNDLGKIANTAVDSDDILKYGAIEAIISSVGVNFEKEIVSNTEREIGYIDIVDKKVLLQIGKKFKFVDMVIIQMPINSDRYIAGERVKSISFIKYVEKNDPNALPNLISFISEMNITAN